MTAEEKRAQARRMREAALSFGPETARTMIEMAESLEAEADSEADGEEPENRPPMPN
jgi:hypothetical protein